MSTSLIATLMLVSSGVFTGVLCAFAVERIWIWDQLELRDYAIDFRRSMRRADILQPALLILTIVLAVVYATRVENSARTETIVALGCLFAILGASTIILVPLQKRFRNRTEGDVPPDAEAIRRKWRVGHLVRTALGMSAFALLVHAVVYV